MQSAASGELSPPIFPLMKHLASVFRAQQQQNALLWRELVRRPGSVGAICASSRRLAACMASHIDPHPDAPSVVVELGGGTGAITAALRASGLPASRLVVIEHSASLAQHLRQRFEGVCVIHGDAADLPRMLRGGDWPADEAGRPLPIAQIVSGLPLLSIPLPARRRILAAGMQALPAQGRLIQFTYALRAPSPWQQAGLQLLSRERVVFNLPPARVDVLAHPVQGSRWKAA